MKKFLKFVLWTLGGLLAFVVLLVATMPLWVGTVARPIVNAVAPKITKTDFSIGSLWVNPYTGRVEVGDFLVGNPEGYSDPRAVDLKKFVVDVKMSSLFGDVVEVEEVTIDDCFVSYSVGGSNNVDNIKQIIANVKGKQPGEEDAAESAEDLKEAEEALAQKDAPEVADENGGRKVVIDRVSVQNVKVKLQMLTVPVPSFTLTDLGKKSGGIGVADAFAEIWNAILKGSMNVGEGAKKAAEAAGKAVDKAGEAVDKAVDKVKGLLNL